MNFDQYDHQVSGHFASALINGDYSGLNDKEEKQLAAWIERNTIGPGHWAGFNEWDDDCGFSRCEITRLMSDCFTVRRLVIKP